MGRKEAITLFVAVAVASVLVRLLILNPVFGEDVNKISTEIF